MLAQGYDPSERSRCPRCERKMLPESAYGSCAPDRAASLSGPIKKIADGWERYRDQ